MDGPTSTAAECSHNLGNAVRLTVTLSALLSGELNQSPAGDADGMDTGLTQPGTISE